MKAYLESEEVAKMEKAAFNLQDKVLVRMLFHLGCRVSEALSLTVENVDFGNSTVTIKHLKARLMLSCTGCGYRLGRSHAFCPKCGSMIEKTQTEQQEHWRQKGLPIDDDALKLLGEYIQHGEPVIKWGKELIFDINRYRAWQVVKKCAEKAGLPKLVNLETGRMHNVSPHTLRDAFAVMAVKRDDTGDGLKMLQEHLGHASFNITARYWKIAGEEHRMCYDRLWRSGNSNQSE